MPISKKDRIQREHKKLDALGLRAEVLPNGTPKKAPKPTSQCTICKMQLITSLSSQLIQHAAAKHPKNTYAECFPA